METHTEQPALTVKVWGTDKNGHDFSQIAEAHDYTDHGALLDGIQQCLQPGGIIGVQYREEKTLARILQIWTSLTPQLSVQLFEPALCPWKNELGSVRLENATRERRRAPRYKIALAVDVRQGSCQVPTHFRTSDISTSGFYVETILPLAVGTDLAVTLWLGREKKNASAIVRTCHASVGMGVQFTDMLPDDEQRLSDFLDIARRNQDLTSKQVSGEEIAQDPLLEP
jgi:hypothetical protein